MCSFMKERLSVIVQKFILKSLSIQVPKWIIKVIIQDCARIYPGVVLAENVIIGECSIVHTVATIINKIRVRANPIIGAGAVIIKDIPGKIIKRLK